MADEATRTTTGDGATAHEPLTCLVTGASGYIGGRLVPELLDAGYRVRCLARTPRKLRDHSWAGRVEVVRGDVLDAASVARAMDGVDVAYYLVHALGTGRDFERTDRDAARVFGEQARRADVSRLVYLGGLTPKGSRSRICLPTCVPVPRWATSCSARVCRPPSCAQQSSSVPARPVSRCCATSPSGFR